MNFKIKNLPYKDPYFIMLSLIMGLATVLRFYGLTNQSLWLDELHTLTEIDPSLTWSDMYGYLKCCDPHPPLYYIIERILAIVFGHTDFVARSLSAICGVVSVWAMYLLGKELLNKSLGLIAALLTCINYYNIYYSQEARCYIMAFLFVVLSYLYFIKLLKGLKVKDALLYGLFALCAIYSHYFSFFIVTSQAVIALIFLIGDKENRVQLLKTFAISGAIIVIGYLPWLPVVMEFSKLKSFWITTPDSSFAVTYFHAYFGNDYLIRTFLEILLLYYCIQVFLQPNGSLRSIKQSPLQLSFMIFSMGIGLTYLIPYIRSQMVVPMLFDRYTIVVVPLFLMACALAIAFIHSRAIQIITIASILILSLTELFIVKNYYKQSKVIKTQFRQMTAFIAEDSENKYPIVEEKTAWHHRYYLAQFDYKVEILSGSKEASVDSILRKKKNYDLDGFWIVGAHANEAKLLPEVQKNLDTAYYMVKSKDFYDTWAQLYIRKGGTSLIPKYFPGQVANFYSADVVPMWGGSIVSQPVPLKAGKYSMTIIAMGTVAKKEFPHLTVYANDRKIGDFTISEIFDFYKITFELSASEKNASFRIDLDNDTMDPATGQDRNAFIKDITIKNQ